MILTYISKYCLIILTLFKLFDFITLLKFVCYAHQIPKTYVYVYIYINNIVIIYTYIYNLIILAYVCVWYVFV